MQFFFQAIKHILQIVFHQLIVLSQPTEQEKEIEREKEMLRFSEMMEFHHHGQRSLRSTEFNKIKG